MRLTDTRELVGLEIDKRWDELHASWVAVQVAEAVVEQAEVTLRRSAYLRGAGIEQDAASLVNRDQSRSVKTGPRCGARSDPPA
jgi:hypothetical protein